MPIRTDPSLSPGVRTHSCSAVYFRSSGYMAAGYPTRHASRSAAAGLRELRTHVVAHRRDVDALQLLDVDGRAVVEQLGARALGEGQRPGEGVRLTDDVDDV